MDNSHTISALQTLQRTLSSDAALLISTPAHIAYLTGVVLLLPEEREALLLITQTTLTLCIAPFLPFESNFAGLTIQKGTSPQTLKTEVENQVNKDKLKTLYFEESTLTVGEFFALQSLPHLKLQAWDAATLWQLRMQKTAIEIEKMTRAAKIASQVMRETITHLEADMTEYQLVKKIDARIRELGADGPAFPSIVAFGPHAALPHHQPDTTALSRNTVVLIDIGATVDGYRSDMTRTVWFGDTLAQAFLDAEHVVLDAYNAGLSVARATSSAAQIDQRVRNQIAAAGYDQFFIHTSGHGVGRTIHEPPSLSSSNQQQLCADMVITIEPGIYFPNQFGYRFENTIHITADEPRELTNAE